MCLLIPLDTVKVRMTTGNLGGVAYAGLRDAISRMARDEGLIAFYRGLPPRLLSVVPMTALQFATYESAKRRIPALEAALGASVARAKRRLRLALRPRGPAPVKAR